MFICKQKKQFDLFILSWNTAKIFQSCYFRYFTLDMSTYQCSQQTSKVSTCSRKLWCLSTCKKSTWSLNSFLRYYLHFKESCNLIARDQFGLKLENQSSGRGLQQFSYIPGNNNDFTKLFKKYDFIAHHIALILPIFLKILSMPVCFFVFCFVLFCFVF